MFHTGYVSAGTITTTDGGAAASYKMSGMPTGIGGAVKFNFGKHLRIGSEGYVSTLRYGVKGSYGSVGWGGVLADCIWSGGRFAPFAGATVGGGRVRNLTLAQPPADDFEVEAGASFRSYPVMIVAPFAGVEYAATKSMRLVVKVDWMLCVSNCKPDYPSGPRIYFGFAFSRRK